MSKPKSILQPAASAGSSVSFCVPADLAQGGSNEI